MHRGWTGLVAVVSVAAGLGSSPAAAAPRVTKGPYVTSVSDTTATVRVELDAASPVDVEMKSQAADAGARLVFSSRQAADMQVVAAAGLTPSTRYGYSVHAGGAVVGTGSFLTGAPPSSRDPVSFLLYGDVRSDDATHAAIVRAMAQAPGDFAINTGDLSPDGGDARGWQRFFDIESPLLSARPVFVSIGNHELIDDQAGAHFARYFGYASGTDAPHLYGTERVGDVRFFLLNGLHTWAPDERSWLEDALTRADGEAGLVWRVAVVHEGPWSSGPHGPNARFLQAKIPELLAEHKVDVIFSGHDHIYERGDAGLLKYVISGGAGAPLYEIKNRLPSTRKAESAYHFVEVTASPDTMSILALRVDGSVLDRCAFHKGGPWDCDPPAPRVELPPSSSAPAAAPAPPPQAGSRCACDAPGAPSGSGAAALLLAATATALAIARGRRAVRDGSAARPSIR